MIRVNLLQSAPTERTSRAFLPPEQRSAIFGLLMLGSCAAGIGGYWWYLSADKSTAQAGIAAAQAELVELERASDLVDQATARKAELTERLTLIDRLRAAKRGPVTLLETVSQSLPEGLWLMELKQAGASVQIDGRALSLTAVTDFAERLQNSGFFERPVEILATTIEVVEETPVVRFSVRGETVTPSVTVTTVSPASTSSPAASTTTSTAGTPPSRPGA
jgi:type IV pilus assembly protein PilN